MNNWKLIVQSVNYLKGVKIKIGTTEEKYQVKQKLQGWKGNFWKYCGFFNSIDFISLIDMEEYINTQYICVHTKKFMHIKKHKDKNK